jgi:hypothetical protein
MAAKCSRGWGKRCPEAKGAKCTCACHGKNHGLLVNRDSAYLPVTASKGFYRVSPFVIRHALWTAPNVRLERFPDRSIKTNVLRKHVHYSKLGFEWGVNHANAFDLALNILSMYVSDYWAWQLHKEFVEDFIAKIPYEGRTIFGIEIYVWLQARRKQITLF